jgi:hypothetical protein
MTKEQAVQILDQAIASMRLTRQEHQALVTALKVLNQGN